MKNWQTLQKNPEKFETFWVREQVYAGIREYFTRQGFHEVETPLLVAAPGTEPFLEVFETTLLRPNQPNQRGFLLTSPEYAMKKLVAAGSGPIYQICKSFRNGEGESSRHNPEFTMIEWYRPNADYTAIMEDCERMFVHLVEQQGKDIKKFVYQGKSYDLTTPWPRMSVAEAFEKYVGIDAYTLLDEEKLKKVAAEKGYQVLPATTWEQAYNQLMLNLIEPHLGEEKPMFLYDYPASQAALARPKASDPRFAERFEWYLGTLELGNAFSELTDSVEQEKRFTSELAERAKMGKTPYDLDRDYLESLKSLPPTGGIAVGVDRLVMLMADVADLRDVTFFPVADVFPR